MNPQCEDLRIVVFHGDDEVVVSVTGELDIKTAPQLREQLIRLLHGRIPVVTVDLADLTFVDSSGLAVLLLGLKRFRAHGGDLKLRSLTEKTQQVFEITGLTKVFSIS